MGELQQIEILLVEDMVRQAGFYWLAINRTPSG